MSPEQQQQLENLLDVISTALAHPTSCNPDLSERLTRAFAEHLEANLEPVPAWAGALTACGNTLRWAGYVNVCTLPQGHQGWHEIVGSNGPTRWGRA